MTPEQWRLVNQIFDHAADLPTAAQAAAVHELSRGEAAVESEVLRLLQSMRQAGDFLASPLLDLHALLPDDLSPAPMFVPGAVILDRFHIRRFLASGGMGEVYEAWDNELEEDVALKTIRPQIARHPEVIERFKQEVRNARGISHPNICRVYEIFHVDTPGGERIWFLSMELVRGTTLLDCIHTKGCLPSADALLIARQMASGLEAAHQYGLVHRDFKSANVMLVEEASKPARAVIMDFGLSARMLQADAIDRHATAGTPGYMAPEQERGGTIGPLADQYAFGVVLCEMLSGALPTWRPAKAEGRRRSTLRGLIRPRQIAAPVKADVHENPQAAARLEAQGNIAVLANGAAQSNAAVHEIVPVQGASAGQVKAVPAEKPRLRLPPHRFSPRAEHVIRRCLDRDPACRFPDMKTAANTLVPPGILGTPWRKAMAVCLLILLALGAWRWRVYQSRCRICDVVQLTPDTDQSDEPSLSADGKLIAYSSDRAATGNLDIFVQTLPNGQAIRLTSDAGRDTEPSLSPDGSMVAFRSERAYPGIYLKKTNNVMEKQLVPDGRGPRFSPDGRSILYWTGDLNPNVATGQIFVRSLVSNVTKRIASSFSDARQPVWSLDGTHILFLGCPNRERSPISCSDWFVADLGDGQPVQTHIMDALRAHGILLYRFSTGAWNGSDLIFGGLRGAKRNLWHVSLSSADWQIQGDPELLLEHNTTDMNPAVAQRTVAYTSVSGNLHIWKVQQDFLSGPQEPEKVTDDAEIDSNPFVSANGAYLIFERGRTRHSIVMRDIASNAETSLLQAQSAISSPIIDDQGKWIAYEQQEQDGITIYYGQTGTAKRKLCKNCYDPSSWFQGHQGFFFRGGLPSSIFLANTANATTQEVVRGNASKTLGNARFSESNHFLLFTVMEGTKSRIATVHLNPTTAQTEDAWVYLTSPDSNAHDPCWSRNGRVVFYISNQNGSQSIHSQGFSPEKPSTRSKPSSLGILHGDRRSIENVSRSSFKLSSGADSLYFNLGEATATIQVGRRSAAKFFSAHSID